MGDCFLFGHAGVDFFFVLSGFIIAYVHARDIGRPERLARYLQRRFTRIYPFYWIICLLTLPLLAFSTHQDLPTGMNIGTSFLLIPIGQLPFIDVAWTLRHEVVFYVLFATLVFDRRLGIVLMAVWFFLSLPSLGGPFDDMASALSVFNLEFLFGLGAAWLLARRTVPAPLAFFGCGAALFFALAVAEDARLFAGATLAPHLGYAIGSMLVIIGLTERERQGGLTLPAFLVSLGTASYAIYLTQGLGTAVGWQVMIRMHLDSVMPIWTQFLSLYIVAAASGWAISMMIERPVLSLVRNALARARGAPAAAAAADG